MPGPFDGIRVIDFGRYIAGPFCAALLGDLGAEVIRIERIGGGEDRGMIPVGAGPATEPFTGGGAMFLAMNRNKLGMTLDPAAPKGRTTVRTVAAFAPCACGAVRAAPRPTIATSANDVDRDSDRRAVMVFTSAPRLWSRQLAGRGR